jgi:dTDP-L-rhamnose 4-epimerase
MKKQRVLVTGGAGFVGSHTVDALLRDGHEVRVFDKLTPQVHPRGELPDYLSPEAEFIRGDVCDLEAVRRAVAGVDSVFHFAAAVGVGQSMYEISHYVETNTLGTANLLQALLDTGLRCQKLVVASSMSIYGEGQYRCGEHGNVAPATRDTEQLREKRWDVCCPECRGRLEALPTSEDKPLQCSSIYALGKKDQEEMCLLFGRTYGMPVLALRYFNIYGTRQALSNPYTGVAAIFASRLLNRRAPMIFEDGEQLRDFVSIHDVVRANMLALESAAKDVALNIGSGQAITISQVARTLSESLQIVVPSEISGKYRAGDIRHCFGEISRAHSVLGYSPAHQFADGVGELANWLRSQSAEDRVQFAAERLSAFGLTA